MVYFENNYIDLTFSAQTNYLYFNFTTAGPDTTIYFVCHIYPEPVNYRDYPFYYNEILQLYVIQFTLPMKLLEQELDYSIWISSYEITSEAIQAKFTTNGTLHVLSESGDQFPPLIKSISAIQTPVSITYSATDTTPQSLGWIVKIDETTGLESANFTVTSDLDIVGYNFTFLPQDAISVDGITLTFSISFNMAPINCTKSHVYKISFASLRDITGRVSQFNAINYQLDPPTFLNPFYNFASAETSVTLTCLDTPTLDVTPPKLKSIMYYTPSEYLNTATQFRSLAVTFIFEDTFGILYKNLPVMFLQSFVADELQVIACETPTILSTSVLTRVTYTTNCKYPYGFGYPNHILISISGVFDTSYNLGYINNNYLDTNATDAALSLETFSTNQGYVFLYGYNMVIPNDPLFNCTFDLEFGESKLFGYAPTKFLIFEPVSIAFKIPDVIAPVGQFYLIIQSPRGKSRRVLIEFQPWVPESSLSQSSSSSSEPSSSSDHSSSLAPPTKAPETLPPVVNKCPGAPVCGGDGKGKCESIGCVCVPPYIGFDCSSLVIPIVVNPNTTTPNTNISIDIPTSQGSKEVTLSSLVQIISLREMSNDDIVYQHLFKEWVYTNISKQQPQYLYQTNITTNDGKTTAINVTVTYYEQQQFIIFAQQNITMNPNSFKYQVSLSQYSFQSHSNYLQLIMSTQFQSDEQDACSYKDFTDFNQDEYLIMQINNHIFNARFIKRALVDNRPTLITNQLINNDKYVSADTPKSSTSFIGINIPYYTRDVIIDPDFSILLSTDSAKDKKGSTCMQGNSSKLSGAKIAGIVVGSVVFVTAVVVSVTYHFYLKKKRADQLKRMNNKLERMNRNNSN
ncbi:hypothetical protein CYY_004026 [Polysphondylium violaceum]|uniref:EGF-like domain-containing protein n=1 Tax=Polysphondylium violaceum TaxID=133409 RepID=A0A8J4PW26_9MYCE|nr:hypothetical protein CYY_004026 [Polysphondylium violaceum]